MTNNKGYWKFVLFYVRIAFNGNIINVVVENGKGFFDNLFELIFKKESKRLFSLFLKFSCDIAINISIALHLYLNISA